MNYIRFKRRTGSKNHYGVPETTDAIINIETITEIHPSSLFPEECIISTIHNSYECVHSFEYILSVLNNINNKNKDEIQL